jgi:hypothetical protein
MMTSRNLESDHLISQPRKRSVDKLMIVQLLGHIDSQQVNQLEDQLAYHRLANQLTGQRWRWRYQLSYQSARPLANPPENPHLASRQRAASQWKHPQSPIQKANPLMASQ